MTPAELKLIVAARELRAADAKWQVEWLRIYAMPRDGYGHAVVDAAAAAAMSVVCNAKDALCAVAKAMDDAPVPFAEMMAEIEADR